MYYIYIYIYSSFEGRIILRFWSPLPTIMDTYFGFCFDPCPTIREVGLVIDCLDKIEDSQILKKTFQARVRYTRVRRKLVFHPPIFRIIFVPFRVFVWGFGLSISEISSNGNVSPKVQLKKREFLTHLAKWTFKKACPKDLQLGVQVWSTWISLNELSFTIFWSKNLINVSGSYFKDIFQGPPR